MSFTTKGSPVLESRDLNFTAYFLTIGGRVLDIQPGSYCTFVLDNHDGAADNALREWALGDAAAPARQLLSAVRKLKIAVREVNMGNDIELAHINRDAGRQRVA